MESSVLESLKKGGAELLALSVLEMFPTAYLKGGDATGRGFYYDFLLDQPFSSEFLVFLEEKMRQNSKKKTSIQMKEMMPSNASAYFASLGREDLEDRVAKSSDPLVSLVQIGDFIDLCTPSLPSNTFQIIHFKLFEFVPIEGGIRIIGAIFPTKEELKKCVKEWESVDKRDHLYLVQKMGLLKKIEEEWIWLPKGEKIREHLTSLWKKECNASGFQCISTPSRTVQEMFYLHTCLLKQEKFQTAEIAFVALESETEEEGLLNTFCGFVDLALAPYSQEDLSSKLISCLQLITRFLKILSFNYEMTVCQRSVKALQDALQSCELKAIAEKGSEPGIYFYIRDVFGRRWKISSVRVDTKRKVVILTVFYSQERLLALLLESLGEKSFLERFEKKIARGIAKKSFL